ncbi:hypothetical protein VTN49DRAFT_457 [Thermomyces lanuginosus]|uniref:uncharacterized protein n=1 Tax=Thermomyces lanuginosus TaxID=5541 RepID=UPI0037424A3F
MTHLGCVAHTHSDENRVDGDLQIEKLRMAPLSSNYGEPRSLIPSAMSSIKPGHPPPGRRFDRLPVASSLSSSLGRVLHTRPRSFLSFLPSTLP